MDSIKYIYISALLLCGSPCYSQNLSRVDVFNYITERWQSVTIKKSNITVAIDSQLLSSAIYYIIDGKEYDSAKAKEKIESIRKNDLATIAFSLYSQLNEYNSRIGIFTKNQSKKSKKENYEYIKSAAFNLKKYSLRDTVYGSGNFALLINDELIDPSGVKTRFFSIDFENIAAIHSTWGYQIPVYGEDSKNGVILIWTKR